MSKTISIHRHSIFTTFLQFLSTQTDSRIRMYEIYSTELYENPFLFQLFLSYLMYDMHMTLRFKIHCSYFQKMFLEVFRSILITTLSSQGENKKVLKGESIRRRLS